MKVGAIILARMTSARLPGKGLRKINGREVLGHIIDGLRLTNGITDIIIATSNEADDDPIEAFAQFENVNCFRGSLNNVAERFLHAAQNENLDFAIRVNGDNLFINPQLVDRHIDIAIKGVEFVSNVPKRTFPKGMSVEIVKISLYEKLYKQFFNNSHFEHVTEYLYQHDEYINHYYIENTVFPQIAGKQVAIDTQYDFDLSTKVINKLDKPLDKIELELLYKTYLKCEEEMNFKGKYGPLLIAEIGGNHEGDFEYAKKLTKLAIASDSDFIKFQIYSGNTLVNPILSPDRHKHFKRFELSREQYIELAKMITDAGKRFMASIWDIEMIDWVDDYNPIYKIGSGDLLAWPLLKNIAQRGKPIILSTGLATEEEVVSTVNFIRDCNPLYNDPNFIAVLQCTSMYPIPKDSANLSVMDRLHGLTGATKGYSDHTEGDMALKCAVSMGAQVLEYHFTDSREGQTFRDHKVSLTKGEVLSLIEYIKNDQLLKGDPEKKPVSIEIKNGHVESFRRAVYPKININSGDIITENSLVCLRPSRGISSRFYYDIIGKKAKKDLKAYEVMNIEDFE